MNILVTGGAGFIGSNFVRYWADTIPTTDIVVARRAHLRRQPREPDRLEHVTSSCTADIGDLDADDAAAASHDDRRGRQLRRRVAQQPGDPRPEPRSSARTCSAPRRCCEAARAGRRRPLPPRLDLRGVRRPALDSRRARSPRTSPYRPRTPYNASKAGGDHAVRAYSRDVRAAGHDHQLREQLRPVPVPREGHPALHDARARRPAASAVRVDRRTGASGSMSSTTAPPSTLVLDRGRDRRDVPRRHRRRTQHRGDRRRACSPPSASPRR